MNKTVLLLLGVIVLAVCGFFVFKTMKSDAGPQQKVMQEGDIQPTEPVSPSPLPPANKEFAVTGSNFRFDPSTMVVKKGDVVRITFKSAEGFHDLTIDEFNARTPSLETGKEAVIQFTADKAGVFEYYCSVGNHRQMGMKGTLTVEE